MLNVKTTSLSSLGPVGPSPSHNLSVDFVSVCCLQPNLPNRSNDKRKPGLFKMEWKGDGFWGSIVKLTAVGVLRAKKPAAKALHKELNDPQKEICLNVLETQRSQSGKNRGFRMVGSKSLDLHSTLHWI